jgi:CDP-diacylglycerol--serine O-phosphatidyltransferase
MVGEWGTSREGTMTDTLSHKHFSMIRSFHLADLFTIANGICGVTAIFQAMKFLSTQDSRHLYLGALLVPLALIFDVLDGRIARWRHAASPMGRELDSLADVISFGVAPAAIAFAAGANTRLDQMMLLFFSMCGLSRLARYNVTAESLSNEKGKVEYFEGTPIPTSVVPLGLLILAFYAGRLYRIEVVGVTFHAITLVFLASGALMISKTLRIPKP